MTQVEFQNIINQVMAMLRARGMDISEEITSLRQVDAINNRINQNTFTISDYIKGFSYSLFSNQRIS